MNYHLNSSLLITILLFFPFMNSYADEYVSFSGIYPHLAYYNNEGECGTGAVVPWADRLWVITYGPHLPFGSSDKLYEIDAQLNRIIRPESVGGTHANRMIHRESKQLFIGSYVIDAERNVRVIPSTEMPGRLTGNARHLTDPENKIYFASMEEGFYEVDVNTLEVTVINLDGNALEPPDVSVPLLPGYHGKGLYSSQGRLVYANNGENTAEARQRPDVESGCLAEWDGSEWKVIRRKQFTEVTGAGGIEGNRSEDDPIWTYGWDHRSAILMVRDKGEWYEFRMPKASHTYDGAHGWNTEWPRIREIKPGFYLMTMHGMFWRFPETFSGTNTAGIRPLSTYLKIIGDFCGWQNQVIFGCDDAAKSEFRTTSGGLLPQGTMNGQSNSNLWFVDPEQLDQFGSPIGRGGPWLKDEVKAGEFSVPYYFAGFENRMVHINHSEDQPITFTFEADRRGNGQWEHLLDLQVSAEGYAWYIFDKEQQAEWIRVKTDRDSRSTTLIYQMANSDRRTAQADAIFHGIAQAGEGFSTGLIRPRGENLGTLHFAMQRISADNQIVDKGYYEIGPEMKLQKKDDPQAHQWLREHAAIVPLPISMDEASMIVQDHSGKRYRLPKGDSSLWKETAAGPPRGVREVVTERSLLWSQGNFYELPRENSGGLAKIRPISSSNLNVMDVCSWRGMLVIAGISDEEVKNSHIIRSDDGKCALWFGVLDDLWKMGKARGEGGPWYQTKVKANEASDPYLMTGYDQKELTLQHDSDKPVTFAVEVDITGDGDWVTYQQFEVKPDEEFRHRFPEGFNAYWVRLKSEQDTVATAQFRYF
jgi:hypothetical protein